ncbi:diacylglycerol kinase family protein [Kineosporia sp. NBRC 101731]|uniref:diacylglycerol/lipid kinase family protein n=1 Tax=Kineosporia sp. NBRC 101731 TaxID=3032199 RepID=UPI0024A1D3DA|nr:diacylglycerol kinase family protein [Kineosporia sp. NBRC 101731]GLY28782.1 diacylglycerol kinase [Kineosporia sp. NBRC 101731]
MPFDRVVLIFNPHSTGDAKGKAHQLRDEVLAGRPDARVELLPTEFAGHARTLAREAAGDGRPLIVSVSGDGGYNEVVNGIMDAGDTHAVATVVAAGNANDHHRVTAPRPLPEALAEDEVRRMDLLRLSVNGEKLARYAHSYIGFGITPVVAVELEKGTKGSLREIVTVVRSFNNFRPLRVELADGGRIAIDSLVFSNIPQMAKVLKLSDNGDPEDGLFEVTLTPHEPRWRAVTKAVHAATTGLGEQPSVTDYRFTALKAAPLQIDGEVLEIEEGDRVQIEIAPGALAVLR